MSCKACNGVAVTTCRRTGSDAAFVPVCESTKCVAQLVGMRLEEAKAALEAVQNANPFASADSPATIAAVAEARAVYDAAVVQVRERYAEYLAAVNKPVEASHYLSDDDIAPIRAAVASMRASLSRMTAPISSIGNFSGYRLFTDTTIEHRAVLDMIERAVAGFERLRERRVLLDKAYANDAANGGITPQENERLRNRIDEVTAPIGEYIERSTDAYGRLRLVIRPFDPEVARRSKAAFSYEHVSAVRRAKQMVDAIERRELGPAAYRDVVFTFAFRRVGDNLYKFSVSYVTPDYIVSILRRQADADPIVRELWSFMRRESPLLLALPSPSLVEWLRTYAPRDLVDAAIPETTIRAPGFTPISLREGKLQRVTVFEQTPTTKSGKDRMAMLLYLYEVAINNAFDSRKRDGDDGVSEPKRSAVAAASSSSDM